MFLNKLLIAIDDSPPSQYAVDVGIYIAQRDGCPVEFCVVLDPRMLEQNYGLASMCELAEQLAGELLASAINKAAEAAVPATSTILYRDPAQGIIDAAVRSNSGMIAMGTHGRSGFARAFTSSVAENVLRHSTIPLCVVRRPRTGIVHNRILVPVVDDELSALAARYAIELAKAFTSSLLFCTACTESASGEFLHRFEADAKAAGVVADSFTFKQTQRVPDEIIRNSVTNECDSIVMASHARDGFLRLTQGSVSEAVIRSSLLPVIVLREPPRPA